MIVEKDVLVPTRHGDPVVVDVFRPDDAGPHPVIATMSPYGKDVHWPDRYPLYEQADQSPYAVWETPAPEWWVAQGYVLVRADSPGTGRSPGRLDLLGPQEVQGYVDTVEWAGEQAWSNGRVGALGISWLAMLQWHVAALRPPHLAAIIPWEGSSDVYREFARHGGILSNAFVRFWWDRQIAPQQHGADRLGDDELRERRVDLLDAMRDHPFADGWYQERTADLARIQVPVLAAGNWGSLVLHQRGVLEAFQAVGSQVKQLIVTSGTHIGPFYEEWAKHRQLRFLDRWLKDAPNGAEHDAPVRLAIRSAGSVTWRDEHEWPLARTRWSPLHLDAAKNTLAWTPPADPAEVSYPAPEGGLEFVHRADADVEVTGPVALRLWVSSTTEDIDVFVQLHQVSADGEEQFGIGPQGAPIPLAMGWLRASHRELDRERSLPHRPVHRHDRAVPLTPGEPTPLDIEIWPTSIVLAAGDRLVLRIRGNDEDQGVLAHDDAEDRDTARLRGTTTVHTGGAHDSYLLLPVIPA
jgi:predicted acyl esterase